MNDIRIEKINLNSSQRLKVESFLSTFNLFLDKDVEYTIVAKKEEEIVGTCSHFGKILKCFAVNEEIQGEGIASKLITHITNKLFDEGIYETFIFTKPKNKNIFKGLHYHEVYATDEVVLLEGGMANIKKAIQNMLKKSGLGSEKKAALVMNCNPFTLGHRYIIEKASQENDEVVVFIVEENRSLFPFHVRMNLVKEGTKDLKNVHILPGGNYIISSATFPSYFIREADERLKAYTKLDAGIFAKFIAPIFNIQKRYVGTEPYCNVTHAYNKTLHEVLPKEGIEVIEVDRILKNNHPISASFVRQLIKEENWEDMKKLLPESTYDFLKSHDAQEIIQRIKRSDSPH
ncbi:[citrate (pro-3S)-lyase] ligase [Inediibacterium massiliense]|uniref:[citrate (pro-3S)-lyase] ligase n=1 Tax=Inediibacterium massiliense TaxID=1658111 RepID=UPI0006B4F557|nr:[citrate (pro-3S)-lyase] ligase [Inediibacterium massiliense]